MSIKTKVIDMVSQMPDNSSIDDIGYKLYVLESIEQGLEELDKGIYHTHGEAKEELKEWIKD